MSQSMPPMAPAAGGAAQQPPPTESSEREPAKTMPWFSESHRSPVQKPKPVEIAHPAESNEGECCPGAAGSCETPAHPAESPNAAPAQPAHPAGSCLNDMPQAGAADAVEVQTATPSGG